MTRGEFLRRTAALAVGGGLLGSAMTPELVSSEALPVVPPVAKSGLYRVTFSAEVTDAVEDMIAAQRQLDRLGWSIRETLER